MRNLTKQRLCVTASALLGLAAIYSGLAILQAVELFTGDRAVRNLQFWGACMGLSLAGTVMFGVFAVRVRPHVESGPVSEFPQEITRALAPLDMALTAAHLSPVTWLYSDRAFGNFVVTFGGPRHAFTLTRDRGQFIVSGADRKSLEKAGLSRVFNSAQELLPCLASWLGQ